MDGCHKESILLTRTPGCISFTPCLQITTDSLCVMQSTMWMCLWAERNTPRDMHEKHSVLYMHVYVKVKFKLSKVNHYVHKHHMKHHPMCLNQKKEFMVQTACRKSLFLCTTLWSGLITELLCCSVASTPHCDFTHFNTIYMHCCFLSQQWKCSTKNNSIHITAKEI